MTPLTDERRARVDAMSRDVGERYYLADEQWYDPGVSRIDALRQLLARAAQDTPPEAGAVAHVNLAWWARWLER